MSTDLLLHLLLNLVYLYLFLNFLQNLILFSPLQPLGLLHMNFLSLEILIFILTFHLILILNSFFLHSILLILHNMLTSLPTVIIILWILLLLTLTLNS